MNTAERRRRAVEIGGLVLLVALGIVLHDDYGASWDDSNNREFGRSNYAYMLSGSRDRGFIDHKHGVVHGPVVELLLVGVEKAFRLRDAREIYFARHLATFLLFCAGVAVFHQLTQRYIEDWGLRMAASVMLVLMPRIFADAFYNSVDIGALVFFIFGFASMLGFFERPGPGRAAWHGFVAAAAVDARLTSILIPAMTLAGLWPLLRDRRAGVKREGAPAPRDFAIFGAVFAVVVILLWPYLWTDPLRNFFHSLASTAGFRHDTHTLYLGAVFARNTPWHYNFVWMLVTIPLCFTFFFLIKAAAMMARWKRRPEGRQLALAAWLVVPLAAPVLLGTTLYDSWRHHFFVYPAFVLVAAMGIVEARDFIRSRAPRIRTAAMLVGGLLVAADLAGVLSFTIRSHPYQNVYFNRLAGGVNGARGTFELDYWGLSCRKLLEAIGGEGFESPVLVSGDSIPATVLSKPVLNNLALLPYEMRMRFQVVLPGQAAYFITTDLASPIPPGYPAKPWRTVEVDGVPIAAAFKRGD